jgi:hypothetical protein
VFDQYNYNADKNAKNGANTGAETAASGGTSTNDVSVAEGEHVSASDMKAAKAKADREAKAAMQADNERNLHLLSESDAQWVEYKHLHIAEVLMRLSEFATKYVPAPFMQSQGVP